MFLKPVADCRERFRETVVNSSRTTYRDVRLRKWGIGLATLHSTTVAFRRLLK